MSRDFGSLVPISADGPDVAVFLNSKLSSASSLENSFFFFVLTEGEKSALESPTPPPSRNKRVNIGGEYVET